METRFILQSVAKEVQHQVRAGFYSLGMGDDQIAKVDPSAFLDIEHASDEDLSEFVKNNAFGLPMVFPLSLKKADDPMAKFYTLPVEPMISLTGKNVIVKRHVNKSRTRGSIKERWCQDDYEIQIQGVLISPAGTYPKGDVQTLRELCEAGSLEVESELLGFFGITRICVDSFSFPFTSGLEIQNYTISASSDDYEKEFLMDNILTGK